MLAINPYILRRLKTKKRKLTPIMTLNKHANSSKNWSAVQDRNPYLKLLDTSLYTENKMGLRNCLWEGSDVRFKR